MNLLRLLGRLGPAPLRRLVLYALGSALFSTLVLALVNRGAEEIAAEKSDFVNVPLAAAFVASVLLYMLLEGRMVAHLSADAEEVVDSLRMRLLDQIRRADLWKLERFGQTPLFESVTQSSQLISQNSQFLALTVRSVLLTGTILLYIATISPVAFLLIGGLLGAGTWFYIRLGRALEERQRAMMTEEAALFEGVSDLFDGFKEQRLNSARSRDLNAAFGTVSGRTTTARGAVHLHTWQQFVFGECAFNLMLGVVVFVVPSYSSAISAELVKITAAIFFMSAPVFGLMQSLAVMSAAEAAAGRMMALEGQLSELAEAGSDGPALPVPVNFAELRMEGVEFAFPAPPGEPPFAVGPFDLTIRRGEVIFITGGNGSGKSTFIKLLTGLYHPLRGRITVDGVPVGPQRIAAYRELMATVFADLHLFARLYGQDALNPVEAAELMRWMEMERVTALDGDRFGRRDLSAGQRKRLGLVATILEKAPILILDEWAADQDPHFRFKFYREVVPELKRRGLTIVAVTHDDHYFDVADRRLHMEEGQLTELAHRVEGVA
ncbi:ATP-binding cassette domain-containing protein [Azospirillum argentinense]|uniref:ATP-binding cassette transporter n=1 Tax=Azospirillum argentinense TaxID=2970906 RepID=A0A5B0KY77_9PROT|nr:ATP-binding cassette domain-containing protein [Azospirillum argentinense]KAA1057542.1 ABC-type siderophore export system, fused ATPase and permease components [Azospirillum argentinense]